DLGDVPQRHGPQSLPNVQGEIKYRYSMEALQLMGYKAVGIGEYEMNLPLNAAMDGWALNNKNPAILAANLIDQDQYPDETHSYWPRPKVETRAPGVIEGSPLKVGITSIVGPTVAAKSPDPKNVRFAETPKVLPGILNQLDANKPDVKVLLYQG